MRPPRPAAPLLAALPWVLALAAGAATFAAVRAAAPAPAELGRLLPTRLTAERAMAVEAGWVEAAFPERYLASPPPAPPCPEGLATVPADLRRRVAELQPAARRGDEAALAALGELARERAESWLPSLAYAHALIAHGRLGDAERVLDQSLERGAGGRLNAAAKEARRRGWRGPPREEVLAAIHLLHAAGYVKIERNRPSSPDLWRALKDPIGHTRLVAPGDPSWLELRLPAPGCTGGEAALTTFDLYNDLIVGYLATADFHETEAARARELRRDYRDPPDENPLQAVLVRAREEWRPEREYRVWALSNAERLLRDRLWGSELAPPDPLLAVNLAQLLESARDEAPAQALRGLDRQQAALAAAAVAARGRVPAAQREDFDRVLARVALLAAIRGGKPPELPPEATAGLDDEARRTAAAVGAALTLRARPQAWTAAAASGDVRAAPAPGGDGPDGGDGEARAGDRGAAAAASGGRGAGGAGTPRDGAGPPAASPLDAEAAEALADRARPWLAASRADLAASLARQVRGAPEPVREEVARVAEALLRPGDPRPAELAEIERGLGFAWRLSPAVLATSGWAAAVAALAAAVVAGLLGAWIALHLRLRRALFTSYYRLEAAERLRGPR